MVLVAGPGVAGGYLDPSQDARRVPARRLFVTGDLGSIDADGYIRISGRQKDLIIRGGHNIEPRLIEDALLQSPWVAQAAAVGKPDAHAGELPIAYVELHPGAQVSVDELLRYAAERIPERPAVPKEIIVLDKLPLTAVGKPIKHLLQLDAARRVFNASAAAGARALGSGGHQYRWQRAAHRADAAPGDTCGAPARRGDPVEFLDAVCDRRARHITVLTQSRAARESASRWPRPADHTCPVPPTTPGDLACRR